MTTSIALQGVTFDHGRRVYQTKNGEHASYIDAALAVVEPHLRRMVRAKFPTFATSIAEDALQEGLIRVWTYLSKQDAPEGFNLSFLCWGGMNGAKSYMRKCARNDHAESLQVVLGADEEKEYDDWTVAAFDDHGTPELLTDLEDCLGTTDLAVVRDILAGWRIGEIRERHGLSASNWETMVRRLRTILPVALALA